MTKLFQLGEIHDLEITKSGLKENYALRTVEPRMFPLGQGFVDESTLWAIAKQLENEEKSQKIIGRL
jgi:hypothetical protein